MKLKSTFSKHELAKYIILQGTGKSIQKVNSYLCNSLRPMQWCFTDLIVTEAIAEVAIKSVKHPLQRLSLTVLKTFKGFVYSFTKLIACDHE